MRMKRGYGLEWGRMGSCGVKRIGSEEDWEKGSDDKWERVSDDK